MFQTILSRENVFHYGCPRGEIWAIYANPVPCTYITPVGDVCNIWVTYSGKIYMIYSWWRHQMGIFSVLLAFCVGNSPVIGEFPSQRPVTWSFDVFFDLRLNKRLSKQAWGWWFEMPTHSLWRHCNAIRKTIRASGWARRNDTMAYATYLSFRFVQLKFGIHWPCIFFQFTPVISCFITYVWYSIQPMRTVTLWPRMAIDTRTVCMSFNRHSLRRLTHIVTCLREDGRWSRYVPDLQIWWRHDMEKHFELLALCEGNRSDWNTVTLKLCHHVNININYQIKSQCCKCHDSSAVVKCATLWPDLIIRTKMLAK